MSEPFPSDVIAAAQKSHQRFYPRGPFTSIDLAQWAVESGYGRHMSGVNNPFGIKATQAQIAAGKARRVWTKEFIDGHYISEEQWFANYDSLEEAFDAHAELLTTSHYQRCMDAKTPEAYAEALHECGYATAPNYAQVLISVIKKYNLTQYDTGGETDAIV
jgi:flagellum-specific peptidoglycan hydrolase FlgJ